MTNDKNIEGNFSEDQTVSGIYAISQAQLKTTKSGAPYWHLVLVKGAESVVGRIWQPRSRDFAEKDLRPEGFVRVSGKLEEFNGQKQLNITDAEPIDDPALHGVNLADFLPTSKIPPAEILQDMEEFLQAELSYKPWATLCRSLLRNEGIRSALLCAPGAKSIHHAYAGGLLEHTLGIMRLCKALSELYPQIDKEILLVGALCHDLGKAFELSHGISREYTDAGRLLGHIQIGLETLEPYLAKAKIPENLSLHLKHLVVSHHGELEFGSPCRPQTLEAFVLHYADNLDSKINTVQGALTGSDGEDLNGWSEYHRTLGRYLFQPARTPQPAGEPKENEAKQAKMATPRPEPSPLLKAMGFTATSENS